MKADFGGARVLALETRRADEMARLIENFGGAPTLVPSMREVPLENGAALRAFGDCLQGNNFDVTIWTTGVGAKMLGAKLDTFAPRENWTRAVGSTLVVARGPKPIPVLREWNVAVDVHVPTPNTWREILAALDECALARGFSLDGKRVAIQDFPTLDARFISQLETRGAKVTRVPVYRYELPEDLTPLQDAIGRLINGDFDSALFTAGVQLWHVLKVASQMNLETDCLAALQKICVGAVGPTCAEVLRECGVAPDVVPEHPKMGHLVKECAAHFSVNSTLTPSANASRRQFSLQEK